MVEEDKTSTLNNNLDVTNNWWVVDTQEEMFKKVSKKLEEIWLDDDYVFKKLKEVIDNAVTVAPDWTIITDYTNIMRAINLYTKLKWYWKKPTVIQIANMFTPPDYLT